MDASRLIPHRGRLSVLIPFALAVLLTGSSAVVADGPVTLNDDFEGSNLGTWEAVGDRTFEITIRGDNAAPGQSRWYSFRLQNAAGEPVTIRITNAGQTNAAGAWRFNAPVVSHDDGETWHRITDQTAYEDGVFRFTYTPQSDSDWLALVPVYNFSRWLALLEEIEDHPRVAELEVFVKSLDGNPVHSLTIANREIPQSEKKSVWIVGRQHPAETPSSWMIEGMIRWLLSDDPQAEALLQRCSFYIIGFINPDGVLRGNYRTNAAGLNLNRQWLDPDPETAPTIAAAIDLMTEYHEEHGDVLFFADMHAHSSIRENFFFYHTAEATSQELYDEMLAFKQTLNRINPDFRPDGGRARAVEGSTLAYAFGYRVLAAHSVTYEAAYQDILYGPNAGYLSVEQYKGLGSAFARAIAEFFFDL